MASPYGICEDAPCCGCCGTSVYGPSEGSYEPEYDPDAFLYGDEGEDEDEDGFEFDPGNDYADDFADLAHEG